MLNTLVTGYKKMGKMTVETVEQSDDMKVVMIADGTNHPNVSILQEHVNAVIDLSHPDNPTRIKPLVLGHVYAYIRSTTGHNDIQKRQVEELNSVVLVISQANLSPGIAVLQEVLQMITPMLEESFDMEVVEKHHNQKQNVPNGTAKVLVATVNREYMYREVYGRNGFVEKRQREIGIHAVCGGTAARGHDVYFFGDDKILEIRYTVNSRKIFVNGALRAACFAVTQKPGMYTVRDILSA